MPDRKLKQVVEAYFTDLLLVCGSGGVTNERSLYVPLANLLDGLGGTLRPKVFCSQELVDQGAGLPNFGLYANRPRVEREAAGWVEPERGRFATQSRLRNDPLCVPTRVSIRWRTTVASYLTFHGSVLPGPRPGGSQRGSRKRNCKRGLQEPASKGQPTIAAPP